MSYTVHHSETIEIPYSGYVTGHDGKSVYYSGTERETVHINIHVDTDNFDESVDDCGNHIKGLTASVVATEEAQRKSIKATNRKISKTIVAGFFKTVRSELGQQIAQLKSQVDSTLLHLNGLAERVRDKQRQMEADYNRITDRYSKVFTDLNKELELRIFELDKAAFRLQEEAMATADRTLESDLSVVAPVSGGENARVQSMLMASVTKKRALDAIHRAEGYLVAQQANRNVINRSLHDYPADRHIYLPVCVAESVDMETPSATKPTIYKQPNIPNSARRRMTADLMRAPWQAMDDKTLNLVRREFNANVARTIKTDSPHDQRVREYLNKFINNPIQSLK